MIRTIICAISLIFLVGCASGAKTSNMVIMPKDKTQLQTSFLNNKVAIRNITGGKKTNPIWVSKVDNPEFQAALKQSLKNYNLYNENGKYSLSVALAKLKQPLFGLDFKVDADAQMILQNSTNNNIVIHKNMQQSYTAGVKDHFVAIERMRIANEGVMRELIADIIKTLRSYRQPSR